MIKLLHKPINKRSGLTLLELIITVALFGILTLLITRIYLQVLSAQDRIIDEQNLVGDLNFVTAVFSDQALRASSHVSAFDCDDVTPCPVNEYYCVNSSKTMACLQDITIVPTNYWVASGKMKVQKGTPIGSVYDITSSKVTFNNIAFDTYNSGRDISIKLEASGNSLYNQKVYYQNYFAR